jgi:hypothetical protein
VINCAKCNAQNDDACQRCPACGASLIHPAGTQQETPSGLLNTSIAAMKDWCVGRWWPLRALVVAALAWICARHVADEGYWSYFGGINLGIHEGGHLLFSYFGRWLCTAGGTIAQLSAPLIAAAILLRQGDWFALPLCGAWLADNLYGVAIYCADASRMGLTLVTVGGGTGSKAECHDWHVLLNSVGMLGAEDWLAPLIRFIAFAIGWSSIALGAWQCWRMAHSPPAIRQQNKSL